MSVDPAEVSLMPAHQHVLDILRSAVDRQIPCPSQRDILTELRRRGMTGCVHHALLRLSRLGLIGYQRRERGAVVSIGGRSTPEVTPSGWHARMRQRSRGEQHDMRELRPWRGPMDLGGRSYGDHDIGMPRRRGGASPSSTAVCGEP